MRIAINALLVYGQYSGVQRTILHQARALLAAGGHEYVFLALQDVPLEDELGAGDSRVVRVPVRAGQRLQRIWWEQAALPGVLAREGVDLLYAPGYLTSLRWRGPAVVFVHDTIALSHPQLCTGSNALNYRLLLPPSARHATRVAVPSYASKRDTAHFCRVAPERIDVVPHGVVPPAEPGAAARQAVPAHYGITPPYLLAVSTIEPKKNFDSLIRWFGAWKRQGIPHRLVIAGKWGWGTGPVRAALAAAPFPREIVLTGYVPQAELPSLMAGADLLLMPSRYEGFGLPALEAMALGVPVAVSDQGALPEAVGPAGVVLPLRDSRWESEIPALLRRPDRLSALATAGRAWAAAHTWQRAAEGLLESFERAARARSAVDAQQPRGG